MVSPWGICQRCGFQRRLSALRKEWTGLKVCSKCFDPKPVERPRLRPEGLPVPGASPEPAPVFAEDVGEPDL